MSAARGVSLRAGERGLDDLRDALPERARAPTRSGPTATGSAPRRSCASTATRTRRAPSPTISGSCCRRSPSAPPRSAPASSTTPASSTAARGPPPTWRARAARSRVALDALRRGRRERLARAALAQLRDRALQPRNGRRAARGVGRPLRAGARLAHLRARDRARRHAAQPRPRPAPPRRARARPRRRAPRRERPRPCARPSRSASATASPRAARCRSATSRRRSSAQERQRR